MTENEIYKEIVRLNSAYRAGEAIVSDLDYENLKQKLYDLNPNHKFFKEIEPSPASTGRKEKLPRQMKSLNKVKSFQELKKWIASIGLTDYDALVVMPKYDGISLLVDEKNLKAWTRGSSDNEGQKSDKHIRSMIHGRFGESQYTGGEAIISIDNWNNHFAGKVNQKSGEIYKTRRGTVAGIFAQETPPEEIKYVSYLQYLIPDRQSATYSDDLFLLSASCCPEINFTVLFVKELNEDLLSTLYSEWSNRFDIDGLVITVDSKHKQIELGRHQETGNPNYSIAYKANFEKVYRTTVLGVTCNVSKNGYLRPTVQIEPVEINGAVIDNPTGNNLRFVINNNIQPGSEVDVILSGSVIPKIIKCYDKRESGSYVVNEFGKCPSCGSHTSWNITMTDLVCSNRGCKGIGLAKIVYFFKSMGFENFSEGSIRAICEYYGIYNLVKFVKLFDWELISVPGIGDETVNSYRSQMNEILYAHPAKISLAKLMDASDCFDGVGEKKANAIIENLSDHEMSVVFDPQVSVSSIQFLGRIKGISVATINSIAYGMREFLKISSELCVNFYVREAKKPSSSELSYLSVCFTGVRDADLQKHIEDNGGRIVSSVSKNTTHLVVDDLNTSSSKAKKAKELDIKLLTIKQARELWYF